jgi:hypothetical protein
MITNDVPALGHDPHCYATPRWLQTPRLAGDPSPDVNRYGLDDDGREVWIHGPELHDAFSRHPVWCVRTSTRRLGHNVWDGGCGIFTDRGTAIDYFRVLTMREPSPLVRAMPSWTIRARLPHETP